MAAKPEHLREAKDWFKLTNYDGVRNFSARQWGQQIARRVFLLRAVADNQQSTLDIEVPPLLEDPLSPWNYTSNAIPLRDLTGQDLSLLISLRPQGTTNLSDIFGQDIAELYTESSGLSQFAHIVIDFNARDADIKSSFDNWLQKARNRVNRKLYDGAGRHKGSFPDIGKLRESAFYAWRNNRLLPYCDLKAWSAWRQIKLTELQLAELLFPRENYRMRGLLRPITDNVKKYITLSNANALLAAVNNDTDENV